MDEQRFLRTAELAERYRTSPATCRYWRYIGYGPKSIKVGRHVLYDIRDVEAWEAEQQED